MTSFAVLLEGLQAFTTDRTPDLHAALYSAGGVMGAALPAHASAEVTEQDVSAGHVGRELVSSQGAYGAADALSPRSCLKGREARGAGRSVTVIGRPDGLKATPAPLIASTSCTRSSVHGRSRKPRSSYECVSRKHRQHGQHRLRPRWPRSARSAGSPLTMLTVLTQTPLLREGALPRQMDTTFGIWGGRSITSSVTSRPR